MSLGVSTLSVLWDDCLFLQFQSFLSGEQIQSMVSLSEEVNLVY